MTARDREGESYQVINPTVDVVHVFVVVTSRPVLAPGNWRPEAVWAHTILALDSTNDLVPAGRTFLVHENEICDTFTRHYKQIGSDLSTTG